MASARRSCRCRSRAVWRRSRVMVRMLRSMTWDRSGWALLRLFGSMRVLVWHAQILVWAEQSGGQRWRGRPPHLGRSRPGARQRRSERWAPDWHGAAHREDSRRTASAAGVRDAGHCPGSAQWPWRVALPCTIRPHLCRPEALRRSLRNCGSGLPPACWKRLTSAQALV